MAEAISNRFGIEPEYIEGAGGIFDVRVNGKLIYSKDRTGRFPEHQEVLDEIAKLSP